MTQDNGAESTPKVARQSRLSRGLRAFAAGADAFDVVVYGGAAAGILGIGLWLVGRAIWDTGSPTTRAIFTGLIALALAVLINDIQQRQFSLMSRLLVGAWLLIVILLGIAELMAGL